MFVPYAIAFLLAVGQGTQAVDVYLYDTSNCGTEGPMCRNQPEGSCCFGADLYESCQALNPQSQITAYARQSGKLCGAVVGRSPRCFSVDNGIASISGCIWGTTSAKRGVIGRGPGPADCAPVKADTFAKQIGDKRYMLKFDSPEFAAYQNLTTSEEKVEYIMAHAYDTRTIY